MFLRLSGLLLLGLALFFSPARAEENYLSARVKWRTEYDDNITFSYRQPESDWVTLLSPFLYYNYQSERLAWYTRVGADLYAYLDHSDLNTVNQHLDVDSSYGLTERLSLAAGASYVKDTTLETELRETGIVRFRQDRRHYRLNLSGTYALTELTQLTLEASRARTEYEWRYAVDYDQSMVSLELSRSLRNQRDGLLLRTYYLYIDSDTSTVHNYAWLLGWRHLFSETRGFTGYVGLRHTKTDYYLYYQRIIFYPTLWPPFEVVVERRRETERDWSYVVDLSLDSRGERLFYRLGFSKDLSYSSYGEAVDRSRLTGYLSYRLRPRWRLGLSAGYYLTSSKGRVYEEDNTFFHLTPSVKYLLTERWSFLAGWSYSDYKDRARDHHYHRQRVWIMLQLEFGKPPVLSPPW